MSFIFLLYNVLSRLHLKEAIVRQAFKIYLDCTSVFHSKKKQKNMKLFKVTMV